MPFDLWKGATNVHWLTAGNCNGLLTRQQKTPQKMQCPSAADIRAAGMCTGYAPSGGRSHCSNWWWCTRLLAQAGRQQSMCLRRKGESRRSLCACPVCMVVYATQVTWLWWYSVLTCAWVWCSSRYFILPVAVRKSEIEHWTCLIIQCCLYNKNRPFNHLFLCYFCFLFILFYLFIIYLF